MTTAMIASNYLAGFTKTTRQILIYTTCGLRLRANRKTTPGPSVKGSSYATESCILQTGRFKIRRYGPQLSAKHTNSPCQDTQVDPSSDSCYRLDSTGQVREETLINTTLTALPAADHTCHGTRSQAFFISYRSLIALGNILLLILRSV
jgi:hypothetical protein